MLVLLKFQFFAAGFCSWWLCVQASARSWCRALPSIFSEVDFQCESTCNDLLQFWNQIFDIIDLSRSREAATNLCMGVAAAMQTLSRQERSAQKPAKRRKIILMRTQTIMEMTSFCCDIKCKIKTDSNSVLRIKKVIKWDGTSLKIRSWTKIHWGRRGYLSDFSELTGCCIWPADWLLDWWLIWLMIKDGLASTYVDTMGVTSMSGVCSSIVSIKFLSK